MNFLQEFFVFTRPKTNTITGECKLCGSHYSDNAGSAGNFHKNLKRKHKSEYLRSKFPEASLSNDDPDDLPEDLPNNIIKINQVILQELIVKCNLPPSIIEHVGFRNFLKILAPKWKPTSSRYFTKTLLPSLLNKAKEKIKKLLDDINHLCITIDVWTDRRGRSFIGVTGHFLDADCISHALLLEFLRLKGRHTGENIRNATLEILDNLKIKNKVYRIITDNASSMICAYKFGLNVNDDTQDDNNQQFDNSFIENNQGDYFNILSDWILVGWCESNSDLFDHDNNIGKRLSCFAHSLQLVVRDGLKDAPYLSKSLSKCLKLARKAHRSTKIADLLEDIGKTINRSNATRWSSEYLLIKSVIGLGRTIVDEITDVINDNELKFTNNDFVILQEAVHILEPFADITCRIQSESVVTASLVVPSVVHLIDHLKNMKPHVSFLKKLCNQLEESINKRFAGIAKRLFQENVVTNDPFSDPVYFVCAALDPEFKLYWLDQMNYKPTVQAQMKQIVIQMILDEYEQYIDMSLDSAPPSQLSSYPFNYSASDHTTQSVSSQIIKKRKIFQYHDYVDVNLTHNSSNRPLDEINTYLSDPIRSRFSLYWKNSQFLSLKKIVQRIFSIQASSAPVERVFSQAGLIMSPRRTSMNEEVFRSLVLLRVNQKLI